MRTVSRPVSFATLLFCTRLLVTVHCGCNPTQQTTGYTAFLAPVWKGPHLKCKSRRGIIIQSCDDSIQIVDRSTLTFLEEIELNVPSKEKAVDFFGTLLRCQYDTSGGEVSEAQETVDFKCGNFQFRIRCDSAPKKSLGRIGLKFQSLAKLKERLNDESNKSFFSKYKIDKDNSGNEIIEVFDDFDNHFVCRAPAGGAIPNNRDEPSTDDTYDVLGCCGVEYVEFYCPVGTADRIALFYDSVLDATTNVFPQGDNLDMKIAMIAFGNIDQMGRPEQSFLFKERRSDEGVLSSDDQHFVTVYVGENKADFQQAFENAEMAGLAGPNAVQSAPVNDYITTLEEAITARKFYFNRIIDMKDGNKVFDLSHEIRCANHDADSDHE